MTSYNSIADTQAMDRQNEGSEGPEFPDDPVGMGELLP